METTINSGNGQPIKTLLQAVNYFADLNVAQDCFARMRWPDGPVCPRCGSKDVRYSAKYRRFECSHKHDRRQFTVKTGTIMEDSPLTLDKWAVAFWLEVNAKNSISSYELHRALGITQKSAWFMLHRIRLAVKTNTFERIGGNGHMIEADETFIGGKSEFMHKSKRRKKITGGGPKDKTPILGLFDRRTGKVRAAVLDKHPSKMSLHPIIRTQIRPGSEVITDSNASYLGLEPDYIHSFVDHAKEYVSGYIHTNSLENFWALFKRCIKGTHVSIDPVHLTAYVDSEAFRFNNRELHDGQRFALALKGMAGKRLTYKALIGVLEGAPGNDRDADSGNLPN
jgi:transposase-like protein